MITHTTTILHRLTKDQLIPGIVYLDPVNPRISPLAHIFFKNGLDLGRPYTTLKTQARSLRLLYDFYLTYPPTTPAKRKTFLEDFGAAFHDRAVLNWDRIPDSVFRKAEPHLRLFCKWVAVHVNLVQDTDEADFANLLQESYIFLQIRGRSKLFHPQPTRYHLREQVRSQTIVKAFPVNKVLALINQAQWNVDKIEIQRRFYHKNLVRQFPGQEVHTFLVSDQGKYGLTKDSFVEQLIKVIPNLLVPEEELASMLSN